MRADGLATLSEQQISTLRNGLRIMALRALGDHDAAEDVVQETLLRALDAVTAEVAADAARLGAFTGGIARHVIADVRRRQGRTIPINEYEPASSEPDSLQQIARNQQHKLVADQIARLSPADQNILRTAFFEGLSAAEIAERSKESPEVVRKRKSRALARLRDALENAGHVDAVRPSIV